MTGTLLAIVSAIFFPGIILRVKSIASGRKGPGILQPWKNIILLFRKSSVFSTATSFIFRLAPAVYLATICCALMLLPFPGMSSVLGFEGDFILFAYLLALGKLLFILGALDTGSSFEGMGANREALYSMLTEPAFFILLGTLALLSGHLSMQDIFSHFQFAGEFSLIAGAIAIYLLVQIAMIENSRMPVDDPKTHLELTMVHEVMILDYSGVDLAFIQTGTNLKFVLYGGLIANFFMPVNYDWFLVTAAIHGSPLTVHLMATLLNGIIFLLVQAAFAAAIGLMESFRARKKLAKNPQFIVTLSSIALIAFILVLLLTRNLIR
ncbi:MAG: NADH-quinone oxidoreductase subunit H [Bacteroidetes bacterium]|nr:NADH-quinone oxidoreductase subunit H [Bacteroidota bacterium]